MLRRRDVLAAFSGLLAAPLLPRGARAAAVWRAVTEYPATAMPGEGVATFAEAVNRLAAGELTVAPAYDGPGGLKSAAMPRAVAEGRVEVADAFAPALAAEDPVFGVSALPFLTASPDDTAALLRAARPAYEEALGRLGLVLLYATPWPATGLWSRRALGTPGDLRGLKVRAYDATGVEVLRAAGAEPVQLPFAEALARVRAGALDAVLSSGDGGAGVRLWESLPHFAALDYASPVSLAFCSAKALEGLPEATRAAVMEGGRETQARQFRAILTRAAENEARMRANGVTLAAAPQVRAVLAAAATPVLAAWTAKAGEGGEAILAAYKAR